MPSMVMEMVFDLGIIGDGMIGSGAAYHASKILGDKCVIIGPGENKCRDGKQNVFGSWYDEGRITRSIDRNFGDGLFNLKSTKRYREIEQESGINFFENVGCVYLHHCDSADLRLQFTSTISRFDIPARYLQLSDARQRYPDFNLHPDQAVLLDPTGGYINPRKLRQAHLKVALKNGCRYVKDIVSSVRQISQKKPRGMIFELETDAGLIIRTKKVLACTGAFSYCRNILPKVVRPTLKPITNTVVYWEIPEEKALQLRYMPCVASRYFSPYLDSSHQLGFYFMPPIQYPNGKYMVKIGHITRNENIEKVLTTPQEIKDWYHSPGNLYAINLLDDTLKTFLKDVKPSSVSSETCVTTHTDDARPILDFIQAGYVVALAGNGHMAKSGNEFGRIAVELVLNERWDSEADQRNYKIDRIIPSKL